MFTDIEFPIKLPPSLNVPVDAVMDSGLKQLVFVDRGQGYFEPRQVKLGWRLGDRVEIREGLKPGESIVISGNFLIDSESRMKLAAAGMFGEVSRDPVCGLNVDAGKAKAAGLVSTFNHKTYSFCSEACQNHFEKNPGRYAEPKTIVAGGDGQTAASEPSQGDITLDPVSGQEVNLSGAKTQGLTSDYQGKTYYFASSASKQDFDKNPELYFKEGAGQRSVAGMVLDPVCGLPVTAEMAKKVGWTSEYQGKTYYFDTEGCKQRFDKDPRRYLTGSETTFAGSYQHIPTDPNLLLKLRRDFLGALPTWRTQELPNPVQVQPQVLPPAAPQTPAPPADPGQHPAPGSPGNQPQGPQAQQQQPAQSPDACHDEGQKQ